MLGAFDPAEFDSGAAPVLSTVFLCLFLLFMMILMLNLLIALMGDTFDKVKSRGKAEWRLEQASIVSEDPSLNDLKIPPFLHVLRYTSDVARGDFDGNTAEYTEEDKAGEERKDMLNEIQKLLEKSK